MSAIIDCDFKIRSRRDGVSSCGQSQHELISFHGSGLHVLYCGYCPHRSVTGLNFSTVYRLWDCTSSMWNWGGITGYSTEVTRPDVRITSCKLLLERHRDSQLKVASAETSSRP